MAYQTLCTRFSIPTLIFCPSGCTLTEPTLDSEIMWNGDLWLKTVFQKNAKLLGNQISLSFFAIFYNIKFICIIFCNFCCC